MECEQYLYLYGYPDELPIHSISTFDFILIIILSISLLTAFTLLLDKFVKDDLKNYQNEINANLKNLKYYRTTDGADPDQKHRPL